MTDRIAIITGGGSGIGRATALLLAKSGYKVAVCGRREEPLNATVRKIEALGAKGMATICDVRKPEQVEQMFRDVTERFGAIDTLVNNAGGQFPAHAEQITPGGWNAVLSTNLSGTFFCCQTFARLARERGGGGVITNMTIPWYSRGCPGLSHAVAARAGVVALTKSLAVEWAPLQLRVNCIAPGMVATDGLVSEELNGDAAGLDKLVQSVPIGRCASAKEIAGVIGFMVSDSASYITGHTLVVDGGLTLGAGVDFTTFLAAQ